jgi:CheY-like chemotaxis protein
MDGMEAIRKIKSTEQGRAVPIVGVSASVFGEDQEGVLESGADEFIAKPIQEDELWEKIGRLLEIEFLFEEEGPIRDAATASSTGTSITKERLSSLPTDLVEAMRAAVRGGYMEQLAEHAREAAEHDPELARSLLEMVDRYDYPALSELFSVSADQDERE